LNMTRGGGSGGWEKSPLWRGGQGSKCENEFDGFRTPERAEGLQEGAPQPRDAKGVE